MYGSKKSVKLSFNAPATLTFVAICVAAQILSVITKGASNTAVFSV